MACRQIGKLPSDVLLDGLHLFIHHLASPFVWLGFGEQGGLFAGCERQLLIEHFLNVLHPVVPTS